ncbi:SWIM zinc finger family protein [Paenibacillus soyae]|uniref:SWIM zinc finger family protein n=1 Tax=Paenibacillus soyae TaxID=2969249 RepID=A0A9X2S8G5_9BACL|nr:SWIM zinc finger family protein [Paenibacillus soyae]MCR2804319.1 SWIM zinc finger family protein [Paenibacillus soyae]
MSHGAKLLEELEKRIGAELTAPIVKRGYGYYQEGRVQSSQTTVHQTLMGVVRGSDLYAVVMDADHFGYSTCTCPFDGFCKHMAAVFFQYYADERGRGAAEQAYFRMLGLTRASEVAAQRPSAPPPAGAAAPPAGPEPDSQPHPGERGTAEQWLEWMEAAYGDTWKKCRHSLHALQPVLSGLKGLSRDWEKPVQRLHWSTAILFVLEQSERAITTVDSFSRYYHEMSFIRMAEPWIEHLQTLIGELTPLEMSEEELAWSDAIIGLAKRRALLSERQLFEWGYLYLAFCERFSELGEWFRREKMSLLSELDSPSAEDRDESFLHAALGMLYFFEGDDARSIDSFAQGAFEKVQKLVYPCVAQRMESGDWEWTERWMGFLYEKVYAIRSARSIGPFMALCRRADEDRPEQPVWTTYMTELLPYSYAELSEHWLSVKRYEDWADLQLFVGVKPEEIDSPELREVAKTAPHTLLPLYHQSIDAAIGSRNRQGYRLAVKLLKKLEKLYKGTKESGKWDVYLAELVAKNQRLRALQEELWKGKIVT